MDTRILGSILGVVFGTLLQTWAAASILRLDAMNLFERSVTRDLRLTEHGAEIELEVGDLFEDDGPAAGHSYQQPENREKLGPVTWIKKELLIPNPQARAAYLVVLSSEPFEALINGIPQKLGENQSGRKLYKTFVFQPDLLRAGRNEIILHGSGNVMIARDDEFALGSRTRTKHPNRSAKSIDGGKTWDYDHLGPEGKLDGEYGVRVYLEHYRAQGLLTLPVLDVSNLEGKAVGGPVTDLGPITVAAEGEAGPAGRIAVRVRSGDTYVPTEKHWSGWQMLGETGETLAAPQGRYVQVAVEISSGAPLQSPRLRGLRVEASPARPADWTTRIRVLDEHNEQIVRTSILFEYEPLHHPRLRQLREQYKLGEVVRGAKGELELLLRLAHWACNYWDWPNHIGYCYPSWDALEILKPSSDGKPTGGFCLVQPGVLAGLRELRVPGARDFD
jgi:hypothetical protein